MASRFRVFVKKRGKRRTGARWPGLLTEGLLLAGLLALGIYGAYWLFANVLWTDTSPYGWWPWLASIIPLALIGYSITGLVLLLWQNTASTERRAAAVQRAVESELAQIIPARPALPTVPPIDNITDSPGVRLAYRLPIDAATGWVSVTMAVVCLAWNTLVAIFVYRVIQQHLEGQPNWLLTWLLVPFVLAGTWTLVVLARQVLFDILVGTTRIEVDRHPFYAAQAARGFVSQSGQLHVRWLQVLLVCEEQAVYQQGTDTRRETSVVHREVLFSQRKFNITPQQAFEVDFEFVVPPSAMHSFVTAYNAVMWSLVIRARTARWGEFERRFPIFVYPPEAKKTAHAETGLAATLSRP